MPQKYLSEEMFYKTVIDCTSEHILGRFKLIHIKSVFA